MCHPTAAATKEQPQPKQQRKFSLGGGGGTMNAAAAFIASSSSSPTTNGNNNKKKLEGIDRRSLRLMWLRPSLNRLLERGQFDEIRATLAGDDINNKQFNVKRWIKSSYYWRDQTLLHILFRSNPPQDIVEMILDHLEQPQSNNNKKSQPSTTNNKKNNGLNDVRHSLLLCVDGHGRTPLHIAVAMGCDLELIGNLFDRLSRDVAMILANTRDYDGRVPLHYACSYDQVCLFAIPTRRRRSSSFGSGGDMAEIKMITTDERLALIKLLLKASPQSVATIDYKGFTPVDYAHGKGANLKVLCILMSGLRKYVANPLCGYDDHTESECEEVIPSCESNYPVPSTIENCTFASYSDDISVITISTDLCSTTA